MQLADGTEFEVGEVRRLGISVTTPGELTDNPAAAAKARAALPPETFAVHVDVDVLDFTDAPIADSFLGRNTGPSIVQLESALGRLWSDPDCRSLSIGGLNPTHAEGDPEALERLVAALGRALSAER